MEESPIKVVEKGVGYAVSKWLSLQLLLSIDEMKALHEALTPFFLLQNGSIVALEEAILSFEKFINLYGAYIDSLQGNVEIKLPPLAMTRDINSLYALPVRENGFLIKPKYPVIQVQEHRFLLTHDGRYQSKGFGKESARFGLTFSFPQVFIDPDDGKVYQALKEERYYNGKLFRDLQKWQRDATMPTPIWRNGVKEICPFRIGKQFIQEIKGHADLLSLGLQVGEKACPSHS